MALQVPAVNLAAITTDMWPSMRSTLAASWRVLGAKREARHKNFHQGRSVSTTSRAEGHVTPVALPGCLASTPVQALVPTPCTPRMGREILVPFSIHPPQNVLRAANPFQIRLHHTFHSNRQYSTLPTFSRQRNTSPLTARIPSLIQRRFMYGPGTSSQNLLAHMEQTANNNPTSASAQNAFYSALQRANLPSIVVERFQTGRYASNDACETTYKRSLEQIAKAEGAGAGAGTLSGPAQANSGSLSDNQLQNIAASIAARSKGSSVAGAKLGTKGTGKKSSPVHVVIEESFGSTFFKWVRFILFYALIAYFCLVVMTIAVEFSGVLKKVGGINNAETQAQQQTVRFTDVHGCDEAKEELQELVEFLKNPERFSTLGGKLPKGILMVGPPGTGKTLLARAVAGEAGVPFFYMSGSEFDEMYVGVGAKRVRELFQNARAKAPAIIFIDELDAIGAKRNERDPTYVKQSLNQLLTELDGFSQDTGVIILGATNFPKLLDKALTRPGRFDRNVEVPLPDVRGRMEILKHHMRDMKIDADVDHSLLARGTSGFSGAELESLVNQAAIRASKNRATRINMMDMEWSKDKIMMGAERRSQVIQEKDKLMTAYHEAGHALVALHTAGAMPLYKATIMPRGQSLGLTHLMPEMDKVSESRSSMRAGIDVSMGGKAAEQIVYGEDMVTSGCSSDLHNATRAAYMMVTSLGMSPLGNIDLTLNYETLSPTTRTQIETEVRKMLDEGYSRARSLLTEKKKDLDTLAKALVEYESLNLEEMKQVLKGEKLKKLSAVVKGEGEVGGGEDGDRGGRSGGKKGEGDKETGVDPGSGPGKIKLPDLVLPPGIVPPSSSSSGRQAERPEGEGVA